MGWTREVDLAAIDACCRCSSWLAKQAGIAEAEMLRTFNCGIGLVAVADEKNAGHVIDAFQRSGDKAVRHRQAGCRRRRSQSRLSRGA